LKKFSKGTFRVQDLKNIEIQGEFSPFIRACIGIGLILLCASPFIFALAHLSAALPWERLLP